MSKNIRISDDAYTFLIVFADMVGGVTLSRAIEIISDQYPEVHQEIERRRALTEQFTEKVISSEER